MAKGSLRRFDVQARWSLWLSLASVVTCFIMVGLLLRNWHSDVRQIMFANPKFQPIYLMCAALTMLLSTFGLVLGWNSAGQRRNDLQRRSWLGFFLGTGVLALAIVFFVAFWTLKLKAPT